MDLKKAVQAMGIKDLRESRADLVILDALPMQEALEHLRGQLKDATLTDEERAAIEAVLASPVQRDLVAESLIAMIATVDGLNLSEDARASYLAAIRATGEKLAVELPAAESAPAAPPEDDDDDDDDDEIDAAESAKDQEPVTPTAPVVDVAAVLAVQRTIESALRESGVPDAVAADIRKAVEAELDADSTMTVERANARVAELVATSKRAAESWAGHKIHGLAPTDEPPKPDDKTSEKAADDLFVG